MITFALPPTASADGLVTNTNITESKQIAEQQVIDTNLTNNINTTVNDDKTNIMTGNALQISSIKNNINQTTVSILQNTTIVNNIKNTLNTGNNTADNNRGDVYINTGNIVSETKIINSSAMSNITNPGNLSKNSSEVIFENAPQSENNIQTLNDQQINYIINNNADVKNDVNSNMNTGNNTARDNTGVVTIKTGDIISNITIQNNVNKNVFDPACCLSNKTAESHPLPQPMSSLPPLQPVPLPQPLVYQSLTLSHIISQTMLVAGIATHTLSLAGNNWLFFSTFANIIMCLFGAYLRLRSGNSPGLLLIS